MAILSARPVNTAMNKGTNGQAQGSIGYLGNDTQALTSAAVGSDSDMPDRYSSLA